MTSPNMARKSLIEFDCALTLKSSSSQILSSTALIYNDDLDLSCDEVWENGTEVATLFDGLISFLDTSELWDLSESTLRKAVAYGKIVPGVDARKYGK